MIVVLLLVIVLLMLCMFKAVRGLIGFIIAIGFCFYEWGDPASLLHTALPFLPIPG